MLGALDSIASFFQQAWSFLSYSVLSMLQFLQILLNAVVVPPMIQGWVTPLLGSAIAAVGSFGIIKMILGR